MTSAAAATNFMLSRPGILVHQVDERARREAERGGGRGDLRAQAAAYQRADAVLHSETEIAARDAMSCDAREAGTNEAIGDVRRNKIGKRRDGGIHREA